MAEPMNVRDIDELFQYAIAAKLACRCSFNGQSGTCHHDRARWLAVRRIADYVASLHTKLREADELYWANHG